MKKVFKFLYITFSRYHNCINIVVFLIFASSVFFSITIPSSLYLFAKDSNSYTVFTPRSPWNSSRSPGYPAFLNLFIKDDRGKYRNYADTRFMEIDNADRATHKAFWYPGTAPAEEITKTGAGRGFRQAALVQIALLLVGYGVFGIGLNCFLPVPLACLAAWIVPLATPLVNPCYILTESLAQPLIFLCAGLSLLFMATWRWRYLLPALFLAGYAFLVRPACAFLIPLCGLLLLCGFWRQRSVRKKSLWLAATGALLLLALPTAYIGQISILAKGFTTNTHGFDMYTYYLATPDDISKINNPTAKIILQKYLVEKDNFYYKILQNNRCDNATWNTKYSIAFRYMNSSFIYYRYALSQVPEYLNLSLLEKSKVSKDISNEVLPRHRMQQASIFINLIKAAFGIVDDYRPSNIARKIKYTNIYLFFLFIVLISLFNRKNNLRMPILFLLSIHLFSVIIISAGGFVLIRYVALTEIFISFTILMALFSILKVFYPKWKTYGLYN
jgi:hypothetical protein